MVSHPYETSFIKVSLTSTAKIGLILIILLKIGFIETVSLTNGTHFECPDSNVTNPCKCFTWDATPPENDTEVEISCRTMQTDEISLRELFDRLNDHITVTNFIDRFEALRLENTAVGQLTDENLFGSISFKSIDLFQNIDLAHINMSVFDMSRDTLETLCIQGSPLDGDEGQFIESLSSFPRLETLILANNHLKGFSDAAFGRVTLSNLSYIDLSGNNLTEIGPKSFFKLPEVHRINLDNNQISYVSNETFTFESEESKLLLLFLRHNNLTADSFEGRAFSNTEKTLFLYLNNNQITHLDESIWRPMFEEKNDFFIAMWSNPYRCDCRSKWMIDDEDTRNYLKKRIHGIRCQDSKRELWDYTVAELASSCP